LNKEYSSMKICRHITGEYEAFLYTGQGEQETIMRIGLECDDPEHGDTRHIGEQFLGSFLKGHPTRSYEQGWIIQNPLWVYKTGWT
jgi:hypothetical protein